MLTFEKVKIRKTIIDYIPSDNFMEDIKTLIVVILKKIMAWANQ
ncbi:hypothetical protein HJ01_01542 [Flavobacterium frigoris PS1]|uniref:Uncharacterized protein n=1 Tax=Flavobacterium frigoris (strain PS1) TaxID=1086011 RepID=H7FQM6_FLAFP|nr:hypothetical protein HJ01_01542 [Flavobacterium frigoris PS1]